MKTDVLVAGGGPAGALAALVLARAGARVRVLERAVFPRDKLCGDTVNPGALALVGRHLPVSELVARGLPVCGMRLTGPGAVTVDGDYAVGHPGLAVRRRDLDLWLLESAAAAGAVVEVGTAVTSAIVDETPDGPRVAGVHTRSSAGTAEHRAPWTLAADGRRSRLMSCLGLARQPASPRRWALGGYFDGVDGLGARGEMHVRRGHYIGVAPMPGGLANTCLVSPSPAAGGWADPAATLVAALGADRRLRPRFARARLVGVPLVLGPMAVDLAAAGVPGLLAAGDAAGFIDPMTGDGLHFAFRGAEMAAAIILDVLAGRMTSEEAPRRLAAARRAAFGAKWRFNRALRSLVAVPAGVSLAAAAARLAPPVFARMIRYAGDQS
jgi:flavin-dependent dehydrogenase